MTTTGFRARLHSTDEQWQVEQREGDRWKGERREAERRAGQRHSSDRRRGERREPLLRESLMQKLQDSITINQQLQQKAEEQLDEEGISEVRRQVMQRIVEHVVACRQRAQDELATLVAAENLEPDNHEKVSGEVAQPQADHPILTERGCGNTPRCGARHPILPR